MSSQLSPKSTFFGGATILAAGIAIVKIIGMLYKIPLVSIIGDSGYADFSNAYNIRNSKMIKNFLHRALCFIPLLFSSNIFFFIVFIPL